MEQLIRLEGVTKRFGAPGSGADLEVLFEVDLEVAPEETLAIVGPSGSGKSTLLNVLGSLDRPTAGRVLFAGEDLAQKDADELAAFRNRELGFVFQSHHLLPQCSALENVLVPSLAHGVHETPSGEAVADRAVRLLEAVGLGERLRHRPGELSGGERQRVAVARALVLAPRLVLADEPTGSLDAEGAEHLMELLVDCNRKESVALVVVTHARPLARLMGRVLELSGGRLTQLEP